VLKYKSFVKSDDADWVTFIHGAGGSSTIWHKQVKFLRNHFNLLLIDLRGHGMSNTLTIQNKYSLNLVIEEIIEVKRHLGINKSHFVGVSLGSVIITKLTEKYPELVDKIVLSGAITSFSFRTLFLLRTVQVVKGFIPNIVLYRLFAWIIMPRKSHEESRKIFINEARKIKANAFKKWLRLLPEIKHSIDSISKLEVKRPILFISGHEDYLFVSQIEKFVKNKSNCILKKIKKSGHIVNIDQYKIFNQSTLNFLK